MNGTAMSDFCSLLEEQIPRLRRYARALLKDPIRADDLVQDTLLRSIAKQHLWQPDTNLRAWLFTIMHNLHVNYFRQSVRQEAMVSLDEISATLVATTDPTALRQLRELEDAIAQLPHDQREVILLVGLEGVRDDEAADILSVPVGTVRSRLSRGRETLRRLMDNGPDTAPSVNEPAPAAA